MTKKLIHKPMKDAREMADFDELQTCTLNDLAHLLQSLYELMCSKVKKKDLDEMQSATHDIANMMMHTNMKVYPDDDAYGDYGDIVGLMATGMMALDMADTFIANLNSWGLLSKPSDEDSEDEDSCNCEGHCPFCGSSECEIVCEIQDEDEPCVCKCNDCGEFWVTR